MGEWGGRAGGLGGAAFREWEHPGVRLPGRALSPQEQQQREHEEAMRERSRRSESIEKAAVSAGVVRPVLPRVAVATPWGHMAMAWPH